MSLDRHTSIQRTRISIHTFSQGYKQGLTKLSLNCFDMEAVGMIKSIVHSTIRLVQYAKDIWVSSFLLLKIKQCKHEQNIKSSESFVGVIHCSFTWYDYRYAQNICLNDTLK